MPSTRSGANRATRIRRALERALDVSNVTGAEDTVKIRVCAGSTCNASGRAALTAAIAAELGRRGLSEKVRVVETGCHGLCQEGPIVVVHPQGVFYPRLKPTDIERIIETSVVGDGVVEQLLYRDPASGDPIVRESDVPFYARQTRLVRAANGYIDPLSIDDYLARGGYASLANVLAENDPMGVIELLERSEVRGRGGAGFPAGKKWRFCRADPDEAVRVICNGDEGDSGALVDRAVLEDNPHSVIEGMLIAAFVVGAEEGVVYVRHEHPLAVARLRHALAQARERGLLGADILGSGWDFDLRINQGAGAFVCGESATSANDDRGMPCVRRGPANALDPADALGRSAPISLHNVETYATVPWIVEHGSEAFRALGTETSKGTKIFALTGKVRNTGLVEVPMGTSLREVIYEIGGGLPPGRTFKAVQLGGPSGGCLPADLLDTPVDFENLSDSGTMMGSGIVVMDDTTCMVDFARFSLAFASRESCGRCAPCRLGTKRMLETLDRVAAGHGRSVDIELLEELADYVKQTAACSVGGGAPDTVLSTIRHFRDEYAAHIDEQRCPAGRCKELITYFIDAAACTGCAECVEKCPPSVISGDQEQPHVIDVTRCIKCDICRWVCRFDAVKVRSGIVATAGVE